MLRLGGGGLGIDFRDWVEGLWLRGGVSLGSHGIWKVDREWSRGEMEVIDGWWGVMVGELGDDLRRSDDTGSSTSIEPILSQ